MIEEPPIIEETNILIPITWFFIIVATCFMAAPAFMGFLFSGIHALLFWVPIFLVYYLAIWGYVTIFKGKKPLIVHRSIVILISLLLPFFIFNLVNSIAHKMGEGAVQTYERTQPMDPINKKYNIVGKFYKPRGYPGMFFKDGWFSFAPFPLYIGDGFIVLPEKNLLVAKTTTVQGQIYFTVYSTDEKINTAEAANLGKFSELELLSHFGLQEGQLQGFSIDLPGHRIN